MKPTFFDALEARAKEIGSLLCIGLDPHPEDLSAQMHPPRLPTASELSNRLQIWHLPTNPMLLSLNCMAPKG